MSRYIKDMIIDMESEIVTSELSEALDQLKEEHPKLEEKLREVIMEYCEQEVNDNMADHADTLRDEERDKRLGLC